MEIENAVTRVSSNDQIIAEILFRLPWRSVTQFMSVSRRWYRLITDPFMVSNYESRNLIHLGFFYNCSSTHVRFLQHNTHPSYANLQGEFGFQIPTGYQLFSLSCCNGLILYYYANGEAMGPDTDGIYAVRNPFTKQVARLPPSPPLHFHVGRRRYRFLFRGIAFDPSSDPPYFIIAELYDLEQRLHINTFSSQTDRWSSKVQNLPSYLKNHDHLISGPSTFLKDSLYWLLNSPSLATYNIKTQIVGHMSIPGDEAYKHESILRRSLAESRGYLIYTRLLPKDNTLLLWVLKDYFGVGTWNIRRSFSLSNIPISLEYGRVVGFDRWDANVVFIMLKTKILSYHLLRRKFNELHEILPEDDKTNLNDFSPIVCPYQLPRSPPSIPPISYFSILG